MIETPSIIFRKTAIGIAAILLVSILLIISCGGGGNYAGGGIGGTGVYAGVVSGFGSVWVNGIEFDTTGAAITVNGNNTTEANLKVGMKVNIKVENNKVKTIAYESEIKGTIDINSVDTVNNKLTVLGQAIFVDSTTIFDGVADIAGLNAGDMVEVSGFFDAAGNLHATLVEKQQTIGQVKVKGTISNLNTATFTINSLTVNYSGVLNPPSIADGSFVEVKGDIVGTTLIAITLEIENETPPVSSGNKVELEGIITDFTSQSDFKVNGQKVNAANATFDHGTASDLALNRKVEVEGSVDNNGVLIATKIEFKSSSPSGNNIKIKGNVEAIDTQSSTVTVMGITVQITISTILKDGRDGLIQFTISNIALNDFFEIGGFVNNTGKIIATKLERKTDDNDELKGAVDSKDQVNNRLVILGVAIDVSSATFKDINGITINANTFFTTIDTGDIVEVEGNYNSGTAIFTATKAEIKKLN